MNSDSALPSTNDSYATIAEALETLRKRLFASLRPEGFWEGMLSSSALSTATAVSAMALANTTTDSDDLAKIQRGVAWLCEHHNADGGWGDTTDSPSNLATTLLTMSALRLAKAAGVAFPWVDDALQHAGEYVVVATSLAHSSHDTAQVAGGVPLLHRSSAGRNSLAGTACEQAVAHGTGTACEQAAAHDANEPASPQEIARAIRHAYGADRTFAVPILMNCALAGLVAWEDVPGLPFEMAVFPHRWYKLLRLHVVSYALPALIAIGLAVDRHHPPRSRLRRAIRRAVTARVLKKLGKIQPDHGGFLDAAPLTSFVAMGLIPLFGREQPVAARCLQFLRNAQRPDGSWPIDTNLSVWLTTSAVTAVSTACEQAVAHGDEQYELNVEQTARWIAARQGTVPHPFTHAAPGGWAWTHRAGGVPDADDTAGAILALVQLSQTSHQGSQATNRVPLLQRSGAEGDVLPSTACRVPLLRRSSANESVLPGAACKQAAHDSQIEAGVRWLLDLQNSDGGWPTFCRGWGKLPFDQSAPDLTAHVLRALAVAHNSESRVSQRAIRKGLDYLRREQQPDGSWIPLWFGNQETPGKTNPVIGTSLVLRALELLDRDGPQAARGVEYLCITQNTDGGWGGIQGLASTIEETALAVAALAGWAHGPSAKEHVKESLSRGVAHLIGGIGQSTDRPAAIGLYFSRLWYSERLYPLIWSIEALGRAQ